MACGDNAVMKRIGGEQAQFDLDGGDGMDGVGFADGVGVDFAKTDAFDFAFLDQFCQCSDRCLDGDLGVAACTFEDVDGFGVA